MDDESSICTVLSATLKRDGYLVSTALSASQALKIFRDAFSSHPFDVVLQDVRMPGVSGLDLIGQFHEIDPSVIIVVITALSDYQTATEAMLKGAYDFLKKPFDNEADVKPVLDRALRLRRLRRNLKEDPEYLNSFNIIGATARMKDIYDLIRRVASIDSTILIQGESGTGKELIARSIHYQSGRFSESFISVNCGAFSENLLESELFGHLKGSFTSAIADKKGLLEVANKGTFFLDEVSELSAALQVKLLRVIESRQFMPVGSTENKRADVRFIAATNTDLNAQVRNGNFREDLFYRLNVIPVVLPPLRERKDDIPLLAGYFLAKYNKLMGKKVDRLDAEAMESLMNYSWPGNIRELENVIQRGMALAEGTIIKPDSLNLAPIKEFAMCSGVFQAKASVADFSGEEVIIPADIKGLEEKLNYIEHGQIKSALQQSCWNYAEAAQLLGLNIRKLRYKIKKHKLSNNPGAGE